MDKFFEKYPMLKGSIPYFIIGGASTAVELTIFFSLKNRGFDIYHANIFGKMSGLTLSFIFNSLVNFKVKDSIGLRLLMFYGVGIGGLMFSNFLLYLGVECWGFPGAPVKFVSVPVVGFFQFLVNKFFTFGTKRFIRKKHK